MTIKTNARKISSTHLARGSVLAMAVAGTLGAAPAAAQRDTSFGLEEVVVTAQRRERGLQDSPIAVTAVTGDTLRAGNILSYADLARSAAGVSFSEGSPLDQELNIRGVVSVRIDSPTSDPSIGVFIDNVYIGRTGQLNTDFFDIERVEIIRGPQGVLLGKGVVGGALSIVTAAPEQEAGGAISVSAGNYGDFKSYGHLTGALSEDLSGRLSYQMQNRDGFAKDILNNRDLEDKRSDQFRAQLLYQPDGGDFMARLVVDYSQDESNGIHRLGENINPDLAGTKSFSRGRAVVAAARGGLSRRESLSTHPTFVGDTDPTPQFLERESWAVSLNIEKGLGENMTLASVTGYRSGESDSLYSQTGIDPRNPYNLADMTVPLVFDSVVAEFEDFEQFSQEFNLSWDNESSRWEGLVGLYYQHTPIEKNDRFRGYSQPAVFEPPIFAPTLSGESNWFNKGTTDTYAAFGQVGFAFTDAIKLTVGGRYTSDEKDGRVRGLAAATGDFFNPDDTVPLTPLSPTFAEGEGYTANYDESWSEFTPQAILEYNPSGDFMAYFNVAKAFKGGGFEDTPANAAAAQISFDPETVTSYELGAKIDFWDGRARVNAAAYYMDYVDLQVTQTNAECLCNITDNAADAEVRGVELEVQLALTRELRLFGAASWNDNEYQNFVDSLGVDNSGNRLQRTPEHQFNLGFDYTTDFMNRADALNIYMNYAYQGDFKWDPDNITEEPSYGLLDGRISYSPNETLTISAYGKNITNEQYRVFVINFFGDEVASLGAPRTYGLEVVARF
ncbi:TonB-dependent receptor [Kineobactrum salinum]|uniref:TonB-dependent receptor n=1 Tax=Kineobactrum salinum TaxID=2708301 RepID=A0A6C0U732_9GAMM|nr:TonB-dependent receptor [Kineobactrum salinum]QIB65274.1 TonB-dependent receptor [Kineobactrum salinum]